MSQAEAVTKCIGIGRPSSVNKFKLLNNNNIGFWHFVSAG
jgi:hypothetical protein